jgi:hypothetical protein
MDVRRLFPPSNKVNYMDPINDIEEEFKRWRQAHLSLHCPEKDAERCAFMCGFELGLGNDNWVERLLPDDATHELPINPVEEVKDGLS